MCPMSHAEELAETHYYRQSLRAQDASLVTPSRFSSLWLFCTSIFHVLSAFGSKDPTFSSVALKYPTKTGMASVTWPC